MQKATLLEEDSIDYDFMTEDHALRPQYDSDLSYMFLNNRDYDAIKSPMPENGILATRYFLRNSR